MQHCISERIAATLSFDFQCPCGWTGSAGRLRQGTLYAAYEPCHVMVSASLKRLEEQDTRQMCAMCRRHDQRRLYGSIAEAFCLPRYSQRMPTSFACRSATILVGTRKPCHLTYNAVALVSTPQRCCACMLYPHTQCVHPSQTTSFGLNWHSLATWAIFQQSRYRQHSSMGAQLTAALYFSAAPASPPSHRQKVRRATDGDIELLHQVLVFAM